MASAEPKPPCVIGVEQQHRHAQRQPDEPRRAGPDPGEGEGAHHERPRRHTGVVPGRTGVDEANGGAEHGRDGNDPDRLSTHGSLPEACTNLSA
jgi:hypothetical protein